MRAYIHIAKKSFLRKSTYKFEYYLGLFGSLLSIFISVAIWKAVYGSESSVAGISVEEAISYAVLAILLRTTLTMNEFLIDYKIKSGEIATELLRPYSFLAYLFSVIIGEVCFNLWTKVLPLLIVSTWIFRLELFDSWWVLLQFLGSLFLSYLLMYFFNMIFWLCAFWVHQTWSIVTIKNAVVLLLSGATIPFWFLPSGLAELFEWLPFKNIYFTPLAILLGKAPNENVGVLYAEQTLWIFLFAAAGMLMWRKAQRKLVIQGG